MKKIVQFSFIVCFLVLLIASCKKDSFITSADAYIRLSEDTLHFDTVFTTLGSTTQYLKIFNANDQKLKLSSLQLMGGSSSFFKLNVDGIAGTSFTDIELEANDSLYLFATVKIDPTIANLPFLVRDSIKIEFNGNTKWIQLEAFGKNARFMRGYTITKDSSLTNDLPIVILDSLIVNQNAKLTIPKGTNIYVHPNAPIFIKGTLNAIGELNEKIVFQGIRIDEPYRDYPGSFPGIYFGDNSKDNMLQHCIIKNSYQGIIAQSPSVNTNPKVTLTQCILDNIYDVAIGGTNTNITATNCLISNVGFGLYVVSGGDYNFNHCTFVSISNYYLSHKESLITLSNTNSDGSNSKALNVTINNSIIYGEGGLKDDEIAIKETTAVAFNVTMNNVLYKQKAALSNVMFTNSLKNLNPQFDSIDISKRIYNFRLRDGSPCIDSGSSSSVTNDLDGNPRPVGIPDIGCYEKQ